MQRGQNNHSICKVDPGHSQSTIPIRTVIADAQNLLTDLLKIEFAKAPDIELLGVARNPHDAISLILETDPDVLLLDSHLNGHSGFDILSDPTMRQISTRYLFLSDSASDVVVEEALRFKAAGYLLKSESLDNLMHAIRAIARGEYCFTEKISHYLVQDPGDQHFQLAKSTGVSGLSSRQLEVLRYLAQGYSVKEVAKLMHLSPKAIDTHKYRIMKKLNVHERVALARFAIREGIVLP